MARTPRTTFLATEPHWHRLLPSLKVKQCHATKSPNEQTTGGFVEYWNEPQTAALPHCSLAAVHSPFAVLMRFLPNHASSRGFVPSLDVSNFQITELLLAVFLSPSIFQRLLQATSAVRVSSAPHAGVHCRASVHTPELWNLFHSRMRHQDPCHAVALLARFSMQWGSLTWPRPTYSYFCYRTNPIFGTGRQPFRLRNPMVEARHTTPGEDL